MSQHRSGRSSNSVGQGLRKKYACLLSSRPCSADCVFLIDLSLCFSRTVGFAAVSPRAICECEPTPPPQPMQGQLSSEKRNTIKYNANCELRAGQAICRSFLKDWDQMAWVGSKKSHRRLQHLLCPFAPMKSWLPIRTWLRHGVLGTWDRLAVDVSLSGWLNASCHGLWSSMDGGDVMQTPRAQLPRASLALVRVFLLRPPVADFFVGEFGSLATSTTADWDIRSSSRREGAYRGGVICHGWC